MLSSMRMFSPLLTPPYLLTSIPSLNLIMSMYLLFPYPLPCHARPRCLRLRHTQLCRLRQAWPCCLCPCHARPRCLCLCCTRPRRLRLRHVWPRLSDHFQLASSIPPASISGVRVWSSPPTRHSVPRPTLVTSRLCTLRLPSITTFATSTRWSPDVLRPVDRLVLTTASAPAPSPVPSFARTTLVDPHWQCAMEEYEALLANHTCDLLSYPSGTNVLTDKWIFLHKLNVDGTLDLYKARWFFQSFTQRPRVDYDEIFSPVVKLATVRPSSPLPSLGIGRSTR